MTKWAIFTFAIIGAFLACGIGGAAIASLLGLWDLQVAGFFAAFGVVSVAYVSAPMKGAASAFFVFLAGALLAWFLVVPSWYPVTYEERAYQLTHIPFLATLSGGLVALAIALVPFKKRSGSLNK